MDETRELIERLEERKWRLENSFGWGPFLDGALVQRIGEIDRQIARARAALNSEATA